LTQLNVQLPVDAQMQRHPNAPAFSAISAPITSASSSAAWRRVKAINGQLAGPVHIADGGVTGAAYFEHVRRMRRPVINSPKGQTDRLPPDLVRREVIDPEIYWTWSLIWRRSEQRPAVRAAVDAFAEATNIPPLRAEGVWMPDTDPHRVNPRTVAP
jgi:hypothetical protein